MKKSNHSTGIIILVIVLVSAYGIFPMDLIPDIIPAIGYADDVLMAIAAITAIFQKYS